MSSERFRVYSVLDNRLVGEYTTTEEGVQAVGALITLLGFDRTRNAYVLTRPFKKKKHTEEHIVYDQQELWSRALVYYDKAIAEQKKQQRRGFA